MRLALFRQYLPDPFSPTLFGTESILVTLLQEFQVCVC